MDFESSEKEIMSLDDNIEIKTDKIITIISKSKKEYKIKEKFAFVSKTIKSMLEACPNGDTFPLNNIEDDIIKLIVEYMEQQQGRDCEFPRKPLRSKNLKESMTDVNKSWLVEWINKVDDNGNGRIKLYNLINASNFLNIQGLLHLACAKVASFVVEEPLENIPKIFGNINEEDSDEEKKINN